MNKSISSNKCFIHEFAGMPNSGKSTTIRLLASQLRQRGFNVKTIPKGVKRYPFDKKKHEFFYAYWIIADMTKRLAELYPSGKKLVVLIDRGPYDQTYFVKALIKYKYFTRLQGEILLGMTKEFTSCIDSVSLNLCSPETSMNREVKLGGTEGTIMNLPFLTKLHNSYTNFKNDKSIRNLLVVDSDKYILKDNHKAIQKHLMDQLK